MSLWRDKAEQGVDIKLANPFSRFKVSQGNNMPGFFVNPKYAVKQRQTQVVAVFFKLRQLLFQLRLIHSQKALTPVFTGF